MKFENSPRRMAEKLMEFNRDCSETEEEIKEEAMYLTELFYEMQKSEKYNALVHHLDIMFSDNIFK